VILLLRIRSRSASATTPGVAGAPAAEVRAASRTVPMKATCWVSTSGT